MPARRSLASALLLTCSFAAGCQLPEVAEQGAAAPDAERAAAPAGTVPPPAARRELAVEEQATIALFRATSPSVVYITSLARRRDFFRMNVLEIPQGSGSGFIW